MIKIYKAIKTRSMRLYTGIKRSYINSLNNIINVISIKYRENE